MEILPKRNHLHAKNIFQPQADPQHRFSLQSAERNQRFCEDSALSSHQKFFQMDRYCSKMSESIILSSDTIES